MKDEDEDWSRWRDVVFRAKGALTPKTVRVPPLSPQNRRRRGGAAEHATSDLHGEGEEVAAQLSLDEALVRLPTMEASEPAVDPDTGTLYCPECYVPLHPDPRPENLYIFLHAFEYTTSLGCFETEMPEWASAGWEWTRS